MNGMTKDVIIGLLVGIGVFWFWKIMEADEYA
jgi:hypothetical protein